MSWTVLTPWLLVLCALSLLGNSAVAMDESASSQTDSSSASLGSSSSLASGGSAVGGVHESPRYGPLVNALVPLENDKRAYTSYRYENKRLPVYQFGLGKRWSANMEDKRGQPFSFGLGKRNKPYSFGLGKRYDYENEDPMRLGLIYPALPDSYAERLALENYLASKRAGGFNFGLGKRNSDMNYDVREYELQERLPSKHSRDNRYQFGLGKRSSIEDYEDNDISANGLSLV